MKFCKIFQKKSDDYKNQFLKKIFSEKVDVKADSKVDALNVNYKKAGGNKPIFNEKIEFDAEPKVDHLNPDYKKTGGNIKVSELCVYFNFFKTICTN